jgi:hypothetical protein
MPATVEELLGRALCCVIYLQTLIFPLRMHDHDVEAFMLTLSMCEDGVAPVDRGRAHAKTERNAQNVAGNAEDINEEDLDWLDKLQYAERGEGKNEENWNGVP